MSFSFLDEIYSSKSQENLIWQVWRTTSNLASVRFLSFVLSWMLSSETLTGSLNRGDGKQRERHCINATAEGQPRVWSVLLYSNNMNSHMNVAHRLLILPTNTQTNSINTSKLKRHIKRSNKIGFVYIPLSRPPSLRPACKWH